MLMKKVIYQTLALSLILSNYVIGQQRDVWTTFTTAHGLAHSVLPCMSPAMELCGSNICGR
jgi:hypothetical protein